MTTITGCHPSGRSGADPQSAGTVGPPRPGHHVAVLLTCDAAWGPRHGGSTRPRALHPIDV